VAADGDRAASAKRVFVQANTFEKDGCVFQKEYDTSVDGIICSWAERELDRCAREVVLQI
jgi:hypothetical protein